MSYVSVNALLKFEEISKKKASLRVNYLNKSPSLNCAYRVTGKQLKSADHKRVEKKKGGLKGDRNTPELLVTKLKKSSEGERASGRMGERGRRQVRADFWNRCDSWR